MVGFVPYFEVPNLHESLDPFLEPLMNDLYNGFIEGFQENYPRGISISCYEPSREETVRVYYCVGKLTTLVSVKQGSF